MRHAYSDLPFLFVLYMITDNQEIICVEEQGKIILPRYEFDAVYGSEAITTALARQMESALGYTGMDGKISLADAKRHYKHEPKEEPRGSRSHNSEDIMEELLYGINFKKRSAELAIEKDVPFRVCVAYDCVPLEKAAELSHAMTPRGQWASELFTYQPFEDWLAEKQARMKQEEKITRMPIEDWHAMITCGKVTDDISVMATAIAEAWIAKEKPPSFPRKNQKKKKEKMIGSISIEELDALEGILKK